MFRRVRGRARPRLPSGSDLKTIEAIKTVCGFGEFSLAQKRSDILRELGWTGESLRRAIGRLDHIGLLEQIRPGVWRVTGTTSLQSLPVRGALVRGELISERGVWSFSVADPKYQKFQLQEDLPEQGFLKGDILLVSDKKFEPGDLVVLFVNERSIRMLRLWKTPSGTFLAAPGEKRRRLRPDVVVTVLGTVDAVLRIDRVNMTGGTR